jgi:PAS domain S-box-containing protein
LTTRSDRDSSVPPASLRFHLPLDSSRLLRARERLRDYLHRHRLSSAVVEDVVLAIDEACTNAVRHSGSADGVEIALWFEGSDLAISVVDHGEGFDIARFDPEQVPELMKDGGRGLFLMARAVDEMRLSLDGGTQVRMRKQCVLPERRPAGDWETGLADPLPSQDGLRRQARRHVLLEEIDEAFAALDWEYRFVHVNRGTCEATGLTHEELLGRSPFDLWPELIGGGLERRVRDAMELGKPSRVEQRYAHSGRWFELRIYPTAGGVSIYAADVTERKRDEEERETEHLRLLAVLDALPMAIGITDSEGRVVALNRAVHELWAGEAPKPEGIEEYGVYRGWWPQTGERLKPEEWTLARALRSARPILGELIEIERFDGARATILSSSVPIVGKDGRTIGAVGVTEDISEQVRRQHLADTLAELDRHVHATSDLDEVLQRALEMGCEALQAVSGSIELRDGASGVLRHHHGLAQDAEAPCPDEPALPATDGAHPGEPVLLRGGLPALSGERPAGAGAAAVLGVSLVVQGEAVGSCCFVLSDDGLRFLDVDRDFTRRFGASVSLAVANAQLFAALREGEARYRTVADFTYDWELWLGPDLSLEYCSPACERVTGYRSEEFLAEPALLESIVHPDDRAYVHEHYRERTPETDRFDFRIITRSGEVRWIAHACQAVVDEDGVWQGRRISHRDISERKEAEEALRLSEERHRTAADALQSVVVQLTDERERAGAVAVELDRERRQLRSMIEQADASIVLLDRDFDFVLVNSTYADACGYAPEDMVGLNHFDLYPHAENEAIFRRVRDTGEPVEFIAKPFEFPDHPERGLTYWDWRLAPVKDEKGTVERLVFSLVEVTERVRAQRLSEALNAVNAARLEAGHILRQVLTVVGEAFECDVGAAFFREGDVWTTANVWNLPEAATAEVLEPERMGAAELAVREHRPLLFEDFATDPEGDRELAERFGLSTTIAIPVAAGRDEVGCLLFSHHEPYRHTDAELEAARKVGAAVSQALESARLYEAQHRIATMLQEQFIHPLPEIEGLETAVATETAYDPELIGGDFHDVFELPDGLVAILIGDVEGKGIRAAGLTETVRSSVRSLALVSPSPRYVLNNVNRLLRQQKSEQFVTTLLVILDPASGEAMVSSAGHPAPLVLSGGGARMAEPLYGPPLGTFDVEYGVQRVSLEAGDSLVLYTDGLIEARSGEELVGQDRLLEMAAGLAGLPVDAVAERLRAQVVEYADELRDDLQVLVVRRV